MKSVLSMYFRRRILSSFVATYLLAGCATNAIVLDRGQDLSEAGTAAAAGVKTYLSDVQRRHLAANVALVASDPGCRWGRSVVIAMKVRYSPHDVIRSMCVAPDERLGPDYQLFTLSLEPVSKEAIAPTLTLVSALADYVSAVDSVLSQKTPDVAKELADLKSKIEDARGAANAVGAKIGDLKPLGDEQVKAATDLIQLVVDLGVEASKAKRLRRLDERQSAALDATVHSLQKQVELWQELWVRGDAQQTVLAYEVAQRAPWAPLDFTSRRAMIEGLVQARTDLAGVDALGSTLVASIEKVGDAERDLRRVLDGRLNEKEKRERAAIVRQRIWRTLKSLAAVASAF